MGNTSPYKEAQPKKRVSFLVAGFGKGPSINYSKTPVGMMQVIIEMEASLFELPLQVYEGPRVF